MRSLSFCLLCALLALIRVHAFVGSSRGLSFAPRGTRLRAVLNENGRASLEGMGQHLFKGAVAAPYLSKQGISTDVIETGSWVHDAAAADKVAAAVLDWARDNGASVYCHWFQPMGAAGLRHGQAACVQNSMIEFNKDGSPQWDFKGKNLLQGETDGSSYLNGGLRATHRAGGYLAVDPSSPIFLRGDTIFIPACLASYEGYALDEKTPLLRASDALSREGARLLGHLGYPVKSLQTNIGLEQEIFLVPRSAYLRRPDLQQAGRTVMGAMPPRGQELSDHYMAPLSSATPALACMQEIQEQCFAMGIPLRTRHREVAPNQFEFAPLFGSVTTQIDQNLVVMQVIEEVAAIYGLAALLAEKPFQGINGSGKHNNWSIATDDGTNLLNVEQLAAKAGPDVFPIIMAAIVKAVDENGDLMRLAIATPGNDFRLGACEAPPAIVSMYLGDDLTNYLTAYAAGDEKKYTPATKTLNLGPKGIAPITVPAQDRNRSSPFPYGGSRFEFRAVGSSQNVSLVNTVLAAIVAAAFKVSSFFGRRKSFHSFLNLCTCCAPLSLRWFSYSSFYLCPCNSTRPQLQEFSDAIEKGQTAKQVAQESLKKNLKVVFNGNGYDADNQKMLTEKGLWRLDSGIDAIVRFTNPKNVKLFSEMGVFSIEECAARQSVMLSHYVGLVEIEANCMMTMIRNHVLPSCRISNVGPQRKLQGALSTLRDAMHRIENENDEVARGHLARKLRLETMIDIRALCDEAEAEVPAEEWTLGTYRELLFLDQGEE